MTPLRALLAWLLLLAVAVTNGTLRQLVYGPSMDDAVAHRISTGIGAVALGVAMWLVLRRWRVGTPARAWALGAFWTGLTVAFEFGMGRAGGHSWDDLLAQYALWRGSLWPLLLCWILIAPAVFQALDRPGRPRREHPCA